MTESLRYDAITFDFWNTLAAERPGYMHELRIARVTRVVDADRGDVVRALDAAREGHIRSWHSGRLSGAAEARDVIADELGIEPGSALRSDLLEAVSFEDIGGEIDLEVAPGVGEVISELRAMGVRTGIICDVGLAPSTVLRAFLERMNLLEQFDWWSFSDDVGHYKPSTQIFDHALGGLGVDDPSRAAHVGDLLRTDVAGARAHGMTAVRYRAINDDDDAAAQEADVVIDGHEELLDLVR